MEGDPLMKNFFKQQTYFAIFLSNKYKLFFIHYFTINLIIIKIGIGGIKKSYDARVLNNNKLSNLYLTITLLQTM